MNMKDRKRTIVFMILLFGIVLFAGTGTASAKTKTVKIDMGKAASVDRRPAALAKAKKVRVKSSRPSVAKATYKKTKGNRRVVITGKKPGTAVVTVRCYLKKGKKKAYRYKVKVTKNQKTKKLARAVRNPLLPERSQLPWMAGDM